MRTCHFILALRGRQQGFGHLSIYGMFEDERGKQELCEYTRSDEAKASQKEGLSGDSRSSHFKTLFFFYLYYFFWGGGIYIWILQNGHDHNQFSFLGGGGHIFGFYKMVMIIISFLFLGGGGHIYLDFTKWSISHVVLCLLQQGKVSPYLVFTVCTIKYFEVVDWWWKGFFSIV